MQIAQLFFHNSILIASRAADFWCFLKELAGLHRILIGFCDLFRKILLKREKTARIIQKAAYKNRQHDFFRLPALICSSRQRRFSCFCLWYQWIECQRCTVPIKMPKSTRINQKTAKKTGSTILSPACLGMFEPSKAFSMFLFMIPVNRVPTLHSFDWKAKNQQESIRKLHKKQAARFFRLPALICSSRQRLFPCFFLWYQ